MRKVALVGSRSFLDSLAVKAAVDELADEFYNSSEDILVISGGADGPDCQAIEYAEARGLKTQVFAADWDGGGKGAGMDRNRTIVHNADFVEIFWDGNSTGTMSVIHLCQRLNKPFRLHKVRKARHKIQDRMVLLSSGFNEPLLQELYDIIGKEQNPPPDGESDGSLTEAQWMAARDYVEAMKNALKAAHRFARVRPK